MKKTFKYLLSMVAVALMGVAFSACTNEDDIDMGEVANWKVVCSNVTAPGKDAAWTNALRNSVNLNSQIVNFKDPEAIAADDTEKHLNKLDGLNETAAKWYLTYAAEQAYQMLNRDSFVATVNGAEVKRADLPENTVFTFTLFRVVGSQQFAVNSAKVTVVGDKVSIENNCEFDDLYEP